MVNYWICVTNEDNWEIIRKKEIWGVPKRFRKLIGKVRKGDLLVFYVCPKKISGIFQAISEPFENKERLFSCEGFGREEVFPYRVRLKPSVVAKEYVQFDDLISKLQFIVKKKKWRAYLRRSMIAIPKEDYDLILDIITQKK